MNGLAILFPGQGSQQPGMAADLAQTDPETFAHHVERVSEASGLAIGDRLARGSAEALMRTDVAQPALYAVCLTLSEIAASLGLRPLAFAGHSVGEFAAAAASGALAGDDAAALVALRGRRMQEAQRERPGAMAVVLGLQRDEVLALCADVADGDVLEPANFNTPTQTVVAGDEAAVVRLLERVERRSRMRALRLPAGGAFHSSLMRPTQDALRPAFDALTWRDPRVPIAANASGTLVTGAAEVREGLLVQIAAPVRWADCVQALLDAGCDRFLELGPGVVLRGLMRQISRRIDIVSAGSRAALEAYVAERQVNA